MRYTHHIIVDDSSLTDAMQAELMNLIPQARTCCNFHFNYHSSDPLGDQIVPTLLGLFNKWGLHWGSIRDKPCYTYYVSRVYEPADLAAAELLVLVRQDRIQREYERDSTGRLLLLATKATKSRKFGRIRSTTIVSNKVRRQLEDGGMMGLKFGEVVLKGKSRHATSEPFWELWSSIVLPKMTNTHQFAHPASSAPERFTGDYSREIMILDPHFMIGEMHYRRSDLAPLGQFDIARTFELRDWAHPALVISQRFYRLCLQLKLPLNVEVVRIDPE